MGKGFLGIAVGVLGGVVLLAGCLQEDQTTGLSGNDGPDSRGPEGAAAGKPSNVTIDETGQVIGAIEKQWRWRVEPNATRFVLEFEITENSDVPQTLASGVGVVVTRANQTTFECGGGLVLGGGALPGGGFSMCGYSVNGDMVGDWALRVGARGGDPLAGNCICGYRMTVDVRY